MTRHPGGTQIPDTQPLRQLRHGLHSVPGYRRVETQESAIITPFKIMRNDGNALIDIAEVFAKIGEKFIRLN